MQALRKPLALVAAAAAAFIALALFSPGPERSYADSGVPITGYLWSSTIGWIDANCLNSGVCASNPFGLSVASDGTISGYAWSSNVGWVSANSLDLAGCPAAPCTATISTGAKVLGWLRALSGNTPQSAWDGFVSLSGANYGPKLLPSGAFSGYAWGDLNVGWVDFEYAHTGYQACTVGYSCSGNTIIYTDPSCSTSPITVCAAPNFCSPGSSACLVPQLSGSITASPLLVRSGQSSRIAWSVANAASCAVTGTDGESWSGASGAQSSAPITTKTSFTLFCTGYAGATPPTLSQSVTISLDPRFQEK